MLRNMSLHPTETLMTLAARTATVFAAALAFFSQDLMVVFNDALQNETTSYVLAIPFMFGYLVYRKRNVLRAVIAIDPEDHPRRARHMPTIAGFLLSTIGVMLNWYGPHTFTPLEIRILALPVFVGGLTLIMFNYQTLRHLVFPIAFLTLLVPPPSEIIYSVGATLSVTTAELSNTIINALGIQSALSSEYGNPLIQIQRSDGTTISFAVNLACSGVYSAIGFFVFAVFIAYIIRDKLWKKVTIFPIGLSLIYLLNLARVTAILLIGYGHGEETALQIFHLLGGWIIIFIGTLFLLVTLEKALKTRISIKATVLTQCPQCNSGPTKRPQRFCLECGRLQRYRAIKLQKWDIAKIIAITIAVLLLLSIQTPVFALKKSPAEVTLFTLGGEQTTGQILPQVPGYTLKFIYRDRDFEYTAKQDASLIYAYIPSDEKSKTLWVTVEIASTSSRLHGWEVCLITWPQSHGYQAQVTQLDLRDIQILENPPIVARYFAFQYTETNQTQVVLYWREKSFFQTNTTAEEKFVKISVVAYRDEGDLETLQATEDLLATIATAIAQYWEPIKKWTQIAILASENAGRLTAIVTGLLIISVAILIYERRKERKANAYAYEKLAKSAKKVVDLVHKTERTKDPTLNNIATTQENLTGKPINKQEFLQMLTETEETGLIRNQIISKEDEPRQVWKTTISFPRTRKILEDKVSVSERKTRTMNVRDALSRFL